MVDSIKARVLTGPCDAGPDNLEERFVELRSHRGQRWLIKHLYWAMTNNQNVVLMPPEELKTA